MRTNPDLIWYYYVQIKALGENALAIWFESMSFSLRNLTYKGMQSTISGHDSDSTVRPEYTISESGIGYENES